MARAPSFATAGGSHPGGIAAGGAPGGGRQAQLPGHVGGHAEQRAQVPPRGADQEQPQAHVQHHGDQAGQRYDLVFDAATGEGLQVAVPSRKEYFGAGCGGASGLVPSILVGGDPVVGGALFAINLLDARPTTPAVLLLNFARADLALGNGCTLYPAAPSIGIQALTNFGGQAFFGLALPADPALVGAEMFGQWAVADLGGAAGPGLASLTQGLRHVFGDS